MRHLNQEHSNGKSFMNYLIANALDPSMENLTDISEPQVLPIEPKVHSMGDIANLKKSFFSSIFFKFAIFLIIYLLTWWNSRL